MRTICLPSFAASSVYGAGTLGILLTFSRPLLCLDRASQNFLPSFFQLTVSPNNITVALILSKQCSNHQHEVCLDDGVYSTVCNITWTVQNIHVVCNKLQFSDGGG